MKHQVVLMQPTLVDWKVWECGRTVSLCHWMDMGKYSPNQLLLWTISGGMLNHNLYYRYELRQNSSSFIVDSMMFTSKVVIPFQINHSRFYLPKTPISDKMLTCGPTMLQYHPQGLYGLDPPSGKNLRPDKPNKLTYFCTHVKKVVCSVKISGWFKGADCPTALNSSTVSYVLFMKKHVQSLPWY